MGGEGEAGALVRPVGGLSHCSEPPAHHRFPAQKKKKTTTKHKNIVAKKRKHFLIKKEGGEVGRERQEAGEMDCAVVLR